MLKLLAAKSILGHSEPASGLTGVIYAACQAAASAAAPILHLRTLNPYLVGVMDSMLSGSGPMRGLSAGRQQSCMFPPAQRTCTAGGCV